MSRRGVLDLERIAAGVLSPSARKVARALVLAIVAATLISQWVRIIARPRGDFPWHYSFADSYYRGDRLYGSGRPIPSLQRHADEHADNVPYPPFWAVAHTPALLLPLHAAQIAAYAVGLAGGGLLLAVGLRMCGTSPEHAADRSGRTLATELRSSLASLWRDERVFWGTALAVLLSGRYLVRDLTECWVNTTLVGLSWLAILLWMRKREWLGGLCLGACIALKLTAALFVPYFLLKRQWKMAAIATVSAMVLTVLPMARYGPHSAFEQLRVWTSDVIAGMAEKDPSRGILGEESYNNLALRPSLARFLMRLPEGHIGRVDSPWYLDTLSLEPASAGLVVKVVTVALVLLGAWKLRRPVGRRDDAAIVWECAAVSLAILLLSPITWQHHAVGVFPALLLIGLSVAREERLRAWMKASIWFYALVTLILNRAIMGKDGTAILLSYHVQTFGLLALLGVVLGMKGDLERRTSTASPECAPASTSEIDSRSVRVPMTCFAKEARQPSQRVS